MKASHAIGIGRRNLASALLVLPLMVGNAAGGSELPVGTLCRQQFLAVDDQADADLRNLNRLIALLESEIADPALSPGAPGFKDGLRDKLEAAKLRRSEVFDKQHDDLNSIRARCDRLRDAKRRPDPADAHPPTAESATTRRD